MELTNLNKDRTVRRKSSVDLGSMVFGKVPPQAKEVEEVILGAILLEKSAYDQASDILSVECFYVEAHQRIFRAFNNLSAKGSPIDSITLVEELKNSEELEFIGGPYAVVKLTKNIVSSANIEAHCRIILEKFLMRELIRVGGEIIHQAYEDSNDVFDLLDFAEENVSGLRMNNVRKHFKTLQSIMHENLRVIENLRIKDESITGVHSGFADLDKVTCGWQPTDLIILAARPSVGKTAFALTLAKNAAKAFLEKSKTSHEKKKGVGFFSLEMNDRQLVNRMLSSESLVWMWRLQNGRMDDEQMNQLYRGADRMNKLDIYIDDTGALKISEFKTKARLMVRKHNVGLIIVDYLQLMKDPNKKLREQEISSISSQLKETAKELEIPIIALSQLSREYGKITGSGGGSGREPILSDLRESGAIEQDADMVMFLFKPTDAEIEEDANLKDIFFNKIEKYRNGTAPVKFIGKFLKNTQTHEYLNVVDERTLQPTGGNWTPAKVADAKQEELFNNKQDPGDDLPF